VDYLYKKVVIAARGTGSLRDALTDMHYRQAPIPGVDSSKNWFAHQGMINAAVNIKNEIEAKNLLERAFNFNQVSQIDYFLKAD
jgi:hypothetical protein